MTTTSHTNSQAQSPAVSTDYEMAWMLLPNLGAHAPELLTEHDRDTISQAVDELADRRRRTSGSPVRAQRHHKPQAVLVEVDRRLTRLLANTERPDATDHLTRCKNLLATVRVKARD